MLPQRLADALGDATVGLAVQDHRIDRPADVVEGGVTDDFDMSGVRVDLDLANRAAEWKRCHPDELFAICRERSAKILGDIVPFPGRARHLEQADGAVGALHHEAAFGKRHVRRICLQHLRSDAAAFVDHRLRSLAHDDAAHPH